MLLLCVLQQYIHYNKFESNNFIFTMLFFSLILSSAGDLSSRFSDDGDGDGDRRRMTESDGWPDTVDDILPVMDSKEYIFMLPLMNGYACI